MAAVDQQEVSDAQETNDHDIRRWQSRVHIAGDSVSDQYIMSFDTERFISAVVTKSHFGSCKSRLCKQGVEKSQWETFLCCDVLATKGAPDVFYSSFSCFY
jgi:hypothetical protein